MIVGGDVVLRTMPRETLDYLLAFQLPVQFILGNCEREMFVQLAGGSTALPPAVKGIMVWVAQQLSAEQTASPQSIGISLVIVAVAALNLILDFDFIERGVAGRAPKYMEWYAAFGLLVTLVWLYLEILRLLSKLQGRGRN